MMIVISKGEPLSHTSLILCAEVASPGYVVADRQPQHVPGLLNLG